jgi:hypothetical protein
LQNAKALIAPIVLFLITSCSTGGVKRGQRTNLNSFKELVIYYRGQNTFGSFIDCDDLCLSAIRSAAQWSASDGLIIEDKSIDTKSRHVFVTAYEPIQGVGMVARATVRVASNSTPGIKTISLSFLTLPPTMRVYERMQGRGLGSRGADVSAKLVLGTVIVR